MVPALSLVYNHEMYHVYVIQSLKMKNLYYGFTTDLAKRLESHNRGSNKATSNGVPWKLIYCETYRSEKDARAREIKLKNYGNSRTHLKKRITNSLL